MMSANPSISTIVIMNGGFRQAYADGVDEFYSNIDDYSNPHTPDIRECIIRLIKLLSSGIELNLEASDHSLRELNYTAYPILDLCAGSGEVTTILKSIEGLAAQIVASDPYTQTIYSAKHDNTIYDWSFDDIINECIPYGLVFSVIICCYALHLCPKEKLKLLCLALSKHSKYLCILSPHKKPVLTPDMGWSQIFDCRCNKAKLALYSTF